MSTGAVLQAVRNRDVQPRGDRAVQIFSGAGYAIRHRRFYRDVRLFRLYEGTNQISKSRHCRNMIKQTTARDVRMLTFELRPPLLGRGGFGQAKNGARTSVDVQALRRDEIR